MHDSLEFRIEEGHTFFANIKCADVCSSQIGVEDACSPWLKSYVSWLIQNFPCRIFDEQFNVLVRINHVNSVRIVT